MAFSGGKNPKKRVSSFRVGAVTPNLGSSMMYPMVSYVLRCTFILFV
ncbi:hypothetical protein RINTHH_9940 [Richelia intracellularis HH01]|uniref:Uncharacterized protein n=1 Tax=Richelia intracellularis HH01 TaxID=1165094 RepID=M1WRY3_9NOST|nr:hypothetical protein RINTHH_9940 [Richelia intracellularis HH01]